MRYTRRCPPNDPKGKIRFPSARAASQALDTIWLNAIRGNQRAEKMPCRYYGRCKRCKGYHLTSTPLREGQEQGGE